MFHFWQMQFMLVKKLDTQKIFRIRWFYLQSLFFKILIIYYFKKEINTKRNWYAFCIVRTLFLLNHVLFLSGPEMWIYGLALNFVTLFLQDPVLYLFGEEKRTYKWSQWCLLNLKVCIPYQKIVMVNWWHQKCCSHLAETLLFPWIWKDAYSSFNLMKKHAQSQNCPMVRTATQRLRMTCQAVWRGFYEIFWILLGGLMMYLQ